MKIASLTPRTHPKPSEKGRSGGSASHAPCRNQSFSKKKSSLNLRRMRCWKSSPTGPGTSAFQPKHMRNTCEKRPKASNPSGFAWFCLHIQAPHLFSSSMLKRLAGSTALRGNAEGHQTACRRRSLKSLESRFRLLGRSTTRSSSSSFDSMSSQVPRKASRYEQGLLPRLSRPPSAAALLSRAPARS